MNDKIKTRFETAQEKYRFALSDLADAANPPAAFLEIEKEYKAACAEYVAAYFA